MLRRLAILVALWFAGGVHNSRAADVLSLAGPWQFALDPQNQGFVPAWFTKDKPDTIRLPGTTDEAGKGPSNAHHDFTHHLSRTYPYYGMAWYGREIEIPTAWNGKTVVLFLERTKTCCVSLSDDARLGRSLGEHDTLAAPQRYELGVVGPEPGRLAPGKHRLTIGVNNAKHPPVRGGHQLSDDTQTNWNGILGRIELQAHDRLWIASQRVLARNDGNVRVEVEVRNPRAVAGEIAVTLAEADSGKTVAEGTAACGVETTALVNVALKLDRPAKLWSEFRPALYVAHTQLAAADGRFRDTTSTRFGFREFTTRDRQFCLNGQTIFLRGKHEACVFPLTGYPPMDVAGWVRVFRIAKEYGLNHYRFHSWCPPEAAFAAADEVGIYLQPELPNFGGDIGKNPAQAAWCLEEGQRILRAFGDHPSFVMLALGNELSGGREVRARLVSQLREFDPRHLFAQASNYDLGNPQFAAGDDYWITFRTRRGAEGAVRGSYAHVDAPLGHVQAGPPGTTHDYTRAIADVPVPVIGHEVGQYQTFPNFREVDKYTGVLRAWNFEVFRQRLAARGMLDQADDFVRASGALAVLCYREEIEAALRTPGFGGFQLLDLQDFPGQGTALVGILNAFMDSKGLIRPQAWRRFCCETVPLALFPTYTWTGGETFTADVKVAHYGPAAIPAAKIVWALDETGGKRLAGGELPLGEVRPGTLMPAGRIRAPLAKSHAARKLCLTLSLPGTPYSNAYDLWVYLDEQVDLPKAGGRPDSAGVHIRRDWNDETAKLLAAGGRVLLLPEPQKPAGIDGFFANDFWCYPMFRRGHPPGTLGMLCDPRHAALAQFPSEFHANWQWFHLLMHSRAVILDGTPTAFRPVVQIIDNFDTDRNHKLGVIFEARVGAGRLLVCTIDLLGLADRPEARQLLASLLRYAGSSAFVPRQGLTAEQVAAVLAPAETKK